MRILLVESGSTKTAWLLLDDFRIIKRLETSGFNPFYYRIQALDDIFANKVYPNIENFKPEKLVYYGAGCSTVENCDLIANIFKKTFRSIEVEVMSDILGAAHALLGNQAGIACVLGTGANVCLYDGNKIIHQVPSLGYFFSDEGSGAYIGKKFLTAFLHGDIPQSLHQKFLKTGSKSREEILQRVYKEDRPSKYLAEIAKFVGENLSHPFCTQLINQSFDDFIQQLLMRVPDYNEYQIGFTGSVAWNLQNLLQIRLKKYGMNDFHFIEDPALALAKYYGARQF